MTDARTSDPRLSVALGRSEARRAMLERLADLGMVLAEEAVQQQVDGPAHPQHRHEPTRDFVQVSRAVRYTLAFEIRVEKYILALRKGGVRAVETLKDPVAVAAPTPRQPLSSARRCELYAAVREATAAEIRDPHEAEWLTDRAERLVEREREERFIALSFREQVGVICADLGLAPDWSRWSDDVGFVADPRAPERDWNHRFAYSQEDAANYARRRKARTAAARPLACTHTGPAPHPRE